MRVSEIGEFGLIEALSRELGIPYPPLPGAEPRPGILADLGDDALVLAPATEATIWTTDTLVEGVHFLPAVTSWRNTGWKALAVNVSDIAAMGGVPDTALVTLMLPGDFCVEDAIEMYRGLRACAEAFGVRIGGGDIVRAPVFAVTVALSGRAAQSEGATVPVLRRSAAKAGDVIAVTGTLGDSAGGLRVLRAEGDRDEKALRLVDAHERPRPRVDAGLRAVRAGIACGMNVSDGLLQDLGHIARASAVGAVVHAAVVPVSPDLAGRFPDDALDLALTGGEDYQLLLCGPRPAFERLIAEGLDLTIVGEVVEGEPVVRVRMPDGSERAYAAGGWDHFRGGPQT